MSRRRPLISASTVMVLAVAVGCSRTPPEPEPLLRAPEPPRLEASAPSPAAAGTRCILPTPAEPPPPAMPAVACPRDPGKPPTLRRGSVAFPEAGGARVEVEIARSEEETARGLMYRTKLGDDAGMLFAMDRREHVFWMRNTCIPLDMLFIDDDGTIVGILENVPVLDEHERTVGCPSSYVLEVGAGWSRRHGVRAGQRVVLSL